VRNDNVQVLTEIEAVLQDPLSVMDEQLVDSLRSHPPGPLLKKGGIAATRFARIPPCPPSEEGGNCRNSLRSHPPGPLLKKGEEAIEQSLHVVVSRLSQMCMG
jgi:hypothetical protein